MAQAARLFCEQVPRLQGVVRDRRANWDQSIAMLRAAKAAGAQITKTSIMLGCGEHRDEVVEAMQLLRQAGKLCRPLWCIRLLAACMRLLMRECGGRKGAGALQSPAVHSTFVNVCAGSQPPSDMRQIALITAGLSPVHHVRRDVQVWTWSPWVSICAPPRSTCLCRSS